MEYEASEELKDEMTLLQRRIVDEERAVLLVFECRSERIQEAIVNEMLNLMDPRIATYSHFGPDGVKDCRGAFKVIAHEPAKGKIAVYDRSWYSWLKPDDLSKDTLDTVQQLEDYFTDNGVILVKVFLDNDKEEKAIGERWMDGPKGTFLSDEHKYEIWNRKAADKLLSATSTPYAPWDVVKVGDGLAKSLEVVIRSVVDRIEGRMKTGYPKSKDKVVPLFDNPRKGLDLSLKADKYKKELLSLSLELNRLQAKLASSDKSLAIVFEGWDAAGKGGSIKRLTRALNPRGYYVNPVAAPTKEENLHTYLWRFATRMPKAGHISIYDRSWYGRMMVEPIEGFCDQEEYGRSAREIRTFERMMADSGCIVLKFWMEISPDEQLRRFEARAADPAKQYKITDEDWRNRDKWSVYEEYIDRMIESTSAPCAPWIAVESEDKKYGRLKVLRAVVEALRKELD